MASFRRPSNPTDQGAWTSGQMPGVFWKYYYCQNGPETFATIAKVFAGHHVKGTNTVVPASLSWQDLTKYNYGTDDPAEINWCVRSFNGAMTRNATGDVMLDAADTNPFIYVPGLQVTASSNIVVPPDATSQINLPPPQSELTRIALRRFNDIDILKHGFLRKSDMNNCLTGHAFRGVDAAMLATLWHKCSDMEDLSDDELGPETSGVSRADLAAYDRSLATGPTPKVLAIANSFAFKKAKIALAGNLLYANAKINPLQVMQGFVGDCWYLAAIVGLRDRADGVVRGMIQAKGDQFVVTFAGDPSSPVTLPWPTDPQIAIVASAQGDGLWLTVLELACGWRRDPSNPIDGLNDGGDSCDTGIRMLTGHAVDTNTFLVTRDSVSRQKLTTATQSGKCMVAGINGMPFSERRNGWPRAHAYTVLSYDPQADTIVIRNPWGWDYEKDSSAHLTGDSMSFADFEKTWSDIAYEQ